MKRLGSSRRGPAAYCLWSSDPVARLGYGLIQAPRYRFRKDLARGVLIEILPDYPPNPIPLAAFYLYLRNRQLSPRVRVFLDWAASVFAEADL